MKLYAAFDLHANNNYLAIIDEKDTRLYKRKLPNEPDVILAEIEPFRKVISGILEFLFIVFRITPFHRNIGRSLLKEPKIYFYDTGLVMGDEGTRLENLVAVGLLKHANWVEDSKGKRCSVQTLSGW